MEGSRYVCVSAQTKALPSAYIISEFKSLADGVHSGSRLHAADMMSLHRLLCDFETDPLSALLNGAPVCRCACITLRKLPQPLGESTQRDGAGARESVNLPG